MGSIWKAEDQLFRLGLKDDFHSLAHIEGDVDGEKYKERMSIPQTIISISGSLGSHSCEHREKGETSHIIGTLYFKLLCQPNR